MCGRHVSPDDVAIEREFKLLPAEFKFPESFNVAPTQRVPVIRQKPQGRVLELLRWGLIPFFAKGEPGKYSTINARIETVETSPSYRGPWKRGQRCLIVTRGFYEWHTNDDGRKLPYFIHLADQPLFAFAGLWERSVKADGSAIESVVIITMPANKLMQDIHNSGNNPHRMPAILCREDHEAWLTGTVEEARAVLKEYAADLMVAWPVSMRVNAPKNNDAKLIELAVA